MKDKGIVLVFVKAEIRHIISSQFGLGRQSQEIPNRKLLFHEMIHLLKQVITSPVELDWTRILDWAVDKAQRM